MGHQVEIGPFVVIVEPTMQNLSAFYACVEDEIWYSTSSRIDAIVLCIKSIKCFEKKHSAVTNHLYEVLEIGLRDLKMDQPLTSVSTLLKNITPVPKKPSNEIEKTVSSV